MEKCLIKLFLRITRYWRNKQRHLMTDTYLKRKIILSGTLMNLWYVSICKAQQPGPIVSYRTSTANLSFKWEDMVGMCEPWGVNPWEQDMKCWFVHNSAVWKSRKYQQRKTNCTRCLWVNVCVVQNLHCYTGIKKYKLLKMFGGHSQHTTDKTQNYKS